MYAAAIRALAAEIFGKSRAALLGAAVLVPVAWLIARAYIQRMPGMDANFGTPFSLMLVVVMSMQLGSVFAYVDLTASGKTSGFPKHILVLPAPTWLLALVPIITGSLFISAFVLLWLRFLTSVEFDLTQRLVLAAAITSVMCWIQAISWELVPLRYLRLVVLLVAVITTIIAVISTFATVPDLLFGKRGGVIALSIMITGGYALAYLAVIRARRGESLDIAAAFKRVFSLPGRSFRHAPLPALSGAVAAQDWFEWTVNGRKLPLFMIIIGAFPLASVAFDRNAPSIALSTMLLVVFYAMVAPMMGAVYISKDMTRRVQMGTFAATRPLSDLELALAKLRVALKSFFLGLAIVFVVIGVIILTSDNNNALLALWSRLTVQLGATGSCLGLLLLLAAITAASWTASVVFMSLQLFYEAVDRKKHGWIITVATVTLFLLLLPLARRAHEGFASALVWLQTTRLEVMIPAIVLTGLALILLRQFRRLAAPAALKPLAVSFTAVTVLGLALLSQLHLLFGYRWALSWVMVTLALLTFMPFLLVPILVGMGRHR